MIEILEYKSTITKWEQLTNDFTAPYTVGEKQSFLIKPVNKDNIHVFELTGNYYVSSQDTDFILDTDIKTIAMIETNIKFPTSTELYSVYLQVRPSWLGNIIQKSVQGGMKPIALTQMPPTPFEVIKPLLDELLYR